MSGKVEIQTAKAKQPLMEPPLRVSGQYWQKGAVDCHGFLDFE